LFDLAFLLVGRVSDVDMELSAAAAVSGGGVMAAHTAAAIADVMDA